MPHEVQRYWEGNAAAFDSLYEEGRRPTRLFNRLFRRALRQRLEIAVGECRARPGCAVLDVGCGSGRASVAMALAGAGEVVGVDFSAPMLEMARTFAAEHGAADRCTFVEADFMEFDPGRLYDVVVALGVFDYVGDPVAFLARMRERATRCVVFSTPRPGGVREPFRRWRYARRDCPLYFYDRGDLERVAREAGFADVEVRDIQAGHVVVARSPSAHVPTRPVQRS